MTVTIIEFINKWINKCINWNSLSNSMYCLSLYHNTFLLWSSFLKSRSNSSQISWLKLTHSLYWFLIRLNLALIIWLVFIPSTGMGLIPKTTFLVMLFIFRWQTVFGEKHRKTQKQNNKKFNVNLDDTSINTESPKPK